MIKTHSKYFNPDECPFEVHGFFEEFIEAETARFLGHTKIEEPTRPLGSLGRTQMTLIAPVSVTRGMKQEVIKASRKRPIQVYSMIQLHCGKKKNQ